MDDWAPISDAPPLLDELVLLDLGLIAEITHPVRSRIVHRLRRPHSAAELADEMGVPVTRLYHHLHRLREHGLIIEVATRRSGARTEVRYRNRARSYRLDPDLARHTPADIVTAVTSLFDVARTELQREFDLHHLDPQALGESSQLSMVTLHLTGARRAELGQRLSALLREFDSDDDIDAPADTAGTQRVRLFTAMFDLSD